MTLIISLSSSVISYAGSIHTDRDRQIVVQRFGVGLVIERSLVRLPAGVLSSQLGQLSVPSLRGRQIEYQPAWLELGGERSLVLGGR